MSQLTAIEISLWFVRFVSVSAKKVSIKLLSIYTDYNKINTVVYFLYTENIKKS